MHIFHKDILDRIKTHAGKATKHTFLNTYLGNDHPRYEISAPLLRKIAKEWMKEHKEMTAGDFAELLTGLIEGESATEKWIAGMMMDYSTKEQRKFDPKLFDHWLNFLVGWAEVDAVCTGDYTITEIPKNVKQWRPLLKKFVKNKNINKRRASLVLLCSPLSHSDDDALADLAFENIDELKKEREGLITKAISWLLRSMIKYHADKVETYVQQNAGTLPKIAVRETTVKLKTGKKTQRPKPASASRSKIKSPKSKIQSRSKSR